MKEVRRMNRLSPKTIARLSPADRLELIGQLWDSLDESDVPLTGAQVEELKRRLMSDNDSASDRPWSEVEAELLARYA
jgi:putative addiction module component (TIGR02574 family)